MFIFYMFKKYFYCIFIIGSCILLTSCSNSSLRSETILNLDNENTIADNSKLQTSDNENTSIDLDHFDNYQNELNLYKENLSNYIQQTINNFNANYPYEIDCSVVVLDIENNELLGSYGDIHKEIVTDNIFKPVSAAILFNEYNISFNTEFENIPYELKNGDRIISFKGEDKYNEKYSFSEGFEDYNNSIYFHALKDQDLNSFYNKLNQLNLSSLKIKYDNGPDEVSTEIIGNNLNASPKELALIYSSFGNSGKLFDSINSSDYSQIFKEETCIQTLELLSNTLKKTDHTHNILKNVKNQKYNISGIFSLQSITENQSEITTWFAGVYPAENPKLTLVLNISYKNSEELLNDYDNIIHTEDFAPIVYEIINYSLDNYIKNNDYFIYIKDLDFFEKSNLEKNTKFIYFGRSTCAKCVIVEPVIQELIKDADGELEIFYFDTDYWRGADNIEELYDKYNIHLVPYLIKIENNEVSKFMDFDHLIDKNDINSSLKNFIQ